jgi:hypothetical protein
LCGGCRRDNAFPAGTVAVVNGRPISLRLLTAVHDLSGVRGTEALTDLSVDALRRRYGNALASLTAYSLAEQELRARGLEVPPERLRSEEARIREEYPGGEFEQALLEAQTDIETWRELLHIRFVLELFAEKVLAPGLAPSPEEILEYYEKHREDFFFPPSVYLRLLTGTDRGRLEAAREALLAAPDARLPPGVHARKTIMAKESVPEEWRGLLERLRPGEMSAPRLVDSQYLAVQLLEELPATGMSVAQAYPLVERALVEERIDESYITWMEEAVGKADIRVSAHLSELHPAGGRESPDAAGR